MADIISIATQNPIALRPVDKISETIELMAKNSFRRIPIVWENELVGIITATDILSIIQLKGLDALEEELQYYMVKEPVFVYRDIEVSEAIQIMFQHDLGSLPIISSRDGTLAGIVTERDLVKAFTKNTFADADLVEFITKVPITKSFATTTIKQIIKTMVDNKIRRIILTDKDKNVKGVVTASNVIRYISDHIIRSAEINPDILKEKANTIAATEVIMANVNQSVAEVAQILVENEMGGLPVLDDNKELIGVFTERDILKLVGTYNLI